MKRLKIIWIIGYATLAVVSPSAMATDSGWYGGGSMGLLKTKTDDARIISGLLGAGFTTTTTTDDDMDIGTKVFGGYQLNRYLAFEAGYFNLGSFGFSATTIPAGVLTGNIKFQGLNFDGLGILPITKKFSAFGRVGFQYSEAKGSFIGTGMVNVFNTKPSKRDANYKFGVGLQYNFMESLGMRIEAERYRINDAVGNNGDINFFSVGVVYRFGKTKALIAAFIHRPIAAAPPPSPLSPTFINIRQSNFNLSSKK